MGIRVTTIDPPCPARRATVLLTIPTSARDLPSDGEAPQIDHDGLRTP